ncbi:MAG: hypothetical protein E4H13_07470, partial [Calditrichales bacterium]
MGKKITHICAVMFILVATIYGQQDSLPEKYKKTVLFEGKFGKTPGKFIWSKTRGEGESPISIGGPYFDHEGNFFLIDSPNPLNWETRIQKISAKGSYIFGFSLKMPNARERITNVLPIKNGDFYLVRSVHNGPGDKYSFTIYFDLYNIKGKLIRTIDSEIYSIMDERKLAELAINSNDEIWAITYDNYKYLILSDGLVHKNTSKKQSKHLNSKGVYFDLQFKGVSCDVSLNNNNYIGKKIIIRIDKKLRSDEASWVQYKSKLDEEGNIYLTYDYMYKEIYKYNGNGKLVSIINMADEIKRSIILSQHSVDKYGNVY